MQQAYNKIETRVGVMTVMQSDGASAGTVTRSSLLSAYVQKGNVGKQGYQCDAKHRRQGGYGDLQPPRPCL